DEQRLLGAKVVSDLARKSVGRGSNRCDGSAIETARPEKCACRVEKTRPHFLAGSAGCTHAVTGNAGTSRATRALLGICPVEAGFGAFNLGHDCHPLFVCITYK